MELNKRRRISWTNKNIDKLNKIKIILDDLQNYKPLTLRQVYYQLVSKGYIENKKSAYVQLSQIIKYARLDGFISWNDIEDRIRVYNDLSGYNNQEHFIKSELKYFLNNYTRNLLQDQNIYIELWIEKDALSSIFYRIAKQYTIPVVVSRGFTSISFLNDFKNRVNYYQKIGKDIKMLYFGDFDPSGIEMLEANKITIENELELNNIDFKRIALLKDDIKKYNLPHDPDAIKKSDTRYKKFMGKYGAYAVELDALHPTILESKIKNAIENEISIDLLNNQKELLKIDLTKIDKLKSNVVNFIEGIK